MKLLALEKTLQKLEANPHQSKPTSKTTTPNSGPELWWRLVEKKVYSQLTGVPVAVKRWQVAKAKNWSKARELLGPEVKRAHEYRQDATSAATGYRQGFGGAPS